MTNFPPLTKKQKEVVVSLLKTPGSFLRKGITVTGKADYRLLDGSMNPKKKFRTPTVDRLAYYGILAKVDGELRINEAAGLTLDMFEKRTGKARGAAA